MPKIFISYRREDAGGHARHLFDELAKRYGRKNVFMDVATLEGGEAWAKRIDEEVAGCDAFIALIGKRWIDLQGAGGNRRLDEPGDYVRREVAAGLKRKAVTIPVLLDGARMPSEDQLPDEIDELARRNAVELTSARWDYELDRLLELLPAPPRRWIIRSVVGVAALLALAAGYFMVSRSLETPPERLEGIFNVAVIDFGERVGEGAQVHPSDDGRWIADRVFDGLSELQDSLASDTDMAGVVGIGRFGEPPRGTTPLEIENSLASLSTQINATLVLYGVLDLAEPPYRFAPSLYLSQEFNGGAELTGENTFGNPIRLALPLDETGPGRQNRLQLVGQLKIRVEALHLFTLGLAYLQIDQPEQALRFFDTADEIEGWQEGKEVLHLFRGASLMLLDREDEARDAFVKALEVGGPDYDRALMGMGNLFQANGRVDRAADFYRRALAAKPSSPLAHIDSKARFNLGLTLAFEARNLEASCAAEEASTELARVVSNYRATPQNEVLRELAYKAEYQQGLIAQDCGDSRADAPDQATTAYEESLSHLEAALDLSEPRAIEGREGRVEDRRWQRDRWIVWRVLGYSQLRLTELGSANLMSEAVASLGMVTARYERALGDVSDEVAGDAYLLLGRALEPSDPAAAARARDSAERLGRQR